MDRSPLQQPAIAAGTRLQYGAQADGGPTWLAFTIVLCSLVGFVGAALNVRSTHLIVCLYLLLAYRMRAIAAEDLLVAWLFLATFLSSLFSVDIGPMPDITFDRVIILPIFWLILARAKTRRRKLLGNGLDRSAALLVGTAGLSILCSPAVGLSVRVFIDSLLFPFLYYLAARAFMRRELADKVYTVCIALLFFLSGLALFERITGTDILPLHSDPKFLEGRVNGPFDFAEHFGLVTAILTVYAANTLATWGNRGGRLLAALLGIGFGILGVFNTLTRGIWIALATGFTGQLLLNLKRMIPMVFFLLLLGIVGLPQAGQLIDTESALYENRVTKTITIYSRLATYRSALKIHHDHRILGTGYGAYAAVYEDELPRYRQTYNGQVSVPTPHNILLGWLAETGLVGLAAYALFVWNVFRCGARVRRLAGGEWQARLAGAVMCVMLVYLSDGLGHDMRPNLGYLNKLFFILLGMLSGTYESLKERCAPAVESGRVTLRSSGRVSDVRFCIPVGIGSLPAPTARLPFASCGGRGPPGGDRGGPGWNCLRGEK